MNRPRVTTEEDLNILLANRDKGRGGGSRAIKGSVVDADHQAVNHSMAVPKGKKPCALSPQYDSKWEETYAAELVMRKHAGLIMDYFYHPFSMWLPGKVRYSPDFLIEYPSGLERRLEIVEVKGWSKNLRDGMTRLKIAAAMFPCFTWKLVKKRPGGGWNETEL